MGDVRSFHGLLTAAALATSGAATADIVYVDDDAPPGGGGTSWATAFRFLQDALSPAPPPDSEIRVAQGTYRPDRSDEFPDGTGDVIARFFATDVSVLRGGYAGLGAEDPDVRDVAAYPTILTGDLLGDDGPDLEHTDDNAFIVLHVDETRVDGFVLCGARIRAAHVFRNVSISNCTFTRNEGHGAYFEEHGGQSVKRCTFRENGGAVCLFESSPELEDCLFVDNRSYSGAAIDALDVAPRARRCIFIRNVAEHDGGAIYVNCPDVIDGIDAPRIIDCLFLGNSATRGGAVSINFAQQLFANCVFVGNQASEAGGAIMTSGVVTVINSSFRNNVAMRGGAIRGRADSDLIVRNSILWRDEPDEISVRDGAEVSVRYSISRGGWPGQGNLDEPPGYVARPDPGPDGTWGTEDDNYGDLHVTAGSPAIDAASNLAVPEDVTQDADGYRRFVDDPDTDDTGNGDAPIVDMGAYEFGAEQCPADLDGDHEIDFNDLVALLGGAKKAASRISTETGWSTSTIS